MTPEIKPKHLDYPLVACFEFGNHFICYNYEWRMNFKSKYCMQSGLSNIWEAKIVVDIHIWLTVQLLPESLKKHPCLVNKIPKRMIWRTVRWGQFSEVTVVVCHITFLVPGQLNITSSGNVLRSAVYIPNNTICTCGHQQFKAFYLLVVEPTIF